MLEKPLSRLAVIQEKHPVLILLLVLTFTLFMLAFAVNLQTDASFDTMYADDSQVTILKNLVSSEFGSTDSLFVLVSLDETTNNKDIIRDIRHPQVLQAMQEVSTSLLEEPTVSQVTTLNTILLQSYGHIPQNLDESKMMISSLEEQGLDLGFLINRDFDALNMFVSVDIPREPGSIEKIETTLQQKIREASKPAGIRMILTGEPSLLNRIMNLLINDNLITIIIAIVFVFFLLWLFFKSWKIALIALQPVILTLIWLAGTLTILNIKITMMTAAVGAMMVGMSIDYSIHMTHAYHELIHKANKQALKKTVFSVGGALMASALTTIAGFLAMLFGVSPSSKIQGIVLAIGIIYAFLSTLIALPCLLFLHRKWVYNKLDEVVIKIKANSPSKRINLKRQILGTLGGFQARIPKTVLIVVLIITILLIPGMSLVRFDTDNANWIPENDPVIESFNEIGASFGGLEQMNLLVMLPNTLQRDYSNPLTISDLRDPKVMQSISQLDGALESLPYVASLSSPTDEIKRINGRIPQDIEQIKLFTQQNPSIQQYFNEDYSIIRLSISSDSFGDSNTNEPRENYFEILHEIETISFPEGILVVPQGGMANFIELEDNLAADSARTTLIGFLFVIIIASLLYRSFVAGLLAFVPIIFAIIWAVGIMGWVGLPFTVLTSGMLAIVMGMGIDFSIHLIHNTNLSLKEGHTIQEAVKESIMSTGEAILAATLTTVTGFLSLVLASLLVTRRLGFTLAIAITTSFLACMLIVPAILVLRHNKKQNKSEKLKQGGLA